MINIAGCSMDEREKKEQIPLMHTHTGSNEIAIYISYLIIYTEIYINHVLFY